MCLIIFQRNKSKLICVKEGKSVFWGYDNENFICDAALPADVSVYVGPHVVTWQIVENSTMRHKLNLCNSLGYSYTSQSTGKGGKFSSHI